MSLQNGCGNHKHVGDNVLKSDGHKRHNWEPDAKDFPCSVLCAERKPYRKTYKPVTADAGNENLAEAHI